MVETRGYNNADMIIIIIIIVMSLRFLYLMHDGQNSQHDKHLRTFQITQDG
jgi:hypothetical protein